MHNVYAHHREELTEKEQVHEMLVVHKHQVMRILILFVRKASSGVFHQKFLSFIFEALLYNTLDCALSL
jgi:hypothetical protein